MTIDCLTPNRAGDALFTDLYELTMAQAYHAEDMRENAVFELFFREMPQNRNFIIAAGLTDALNDLEQLHFTDDDLAYLKDGHQLDEDFLASIRNLRFTGDVFATPEGTPVFPNEPVIQVVAPIMQAQLVETMLLNRIHFQSVIASKAARIVLEARERTVVDFGSRRAHGVDAAHTVARLTYMLGGAGTSNVRTASAEHIPAYGTMAHSYIQAHDDERDAFRAFASQFPATTLLVDTYDTIAGVQKVIDLARDAEHRGESLGVRAIRLDSGDLASLAIQSRAMLDDAGLHDVKIFASSGLDEYRIRELLEHDAPIDGFGVGTKLAVSQDVPSMDFAYKLVEYAGKPRTKFSTGKQMLPGRKQVFRQGESEHFERDVIARFDEELPGTPLLQPVMNHGKRISNSPGHWTLEERRTYAMKQLQRLPKRLRELNSATKPYEVDISQSLAADVKRILPDSLRPDDIEHADTLQNS